MLSFVKFVSNALIIALILCYITAFSQFKNEHISSDSIDMSELVRVKPNNGEWDGYRKEYFHDNGELKSIINFSKNGLKKGKAKWFYSSENIGNHTFYEKGKYVEKLMSTKEYKSGKLHGTLSKYTQNGVLYMESKYKNGQLHGKTIRYYLNGNPEFITKYRKGDAHGKRYLFDENGNKKNGKHHRILPGDSTIFIGNSVSGLAHGKFEYYRNDILIRSGEYSNGYLIEDIDYKNETQPQNNKKID
jgi:hypothetical protein